MAQTRYDCYSSAMPILGTPKIQSGRSDMKVQRRLLWDLTEYYNFFALMPIWMRLSYDRQRRTSERADRARSRGRISKLQTLIAEVDRNGQTTTRPRRTGDHGLSVDQLSNWYVPTRQGKRFWRVYGKRISRLLTRHFYSVGACRS